MHLLVGDYSTSSTEAIENFRSWEEEHWLKVEVPRLFSGAGVFPGVRDGYYLKLCKSLLWVFIHLAEQPEETPP
jgi:hypothetical protein